MIDHQEIIEAAHLSVRTALITHGFVDIPSVDDTFEDPHKQESFKLFIKACQHHLAYLTTEGFVAFENGVYSLRSADDLTKELEHL